MKIKDQRLSASVLSVLCAAALASCGHESDGRHKDAAGAVDTRDLGKGDDGQSGDATSAGSGGGGSATADQESSAPGGGGDQQQPSMPGMPPGTGTDIKQVYAKAGVRNFEQINQTMSALTGIPTTNATVSSFYLTDAATSLPTDNDIKAFTGSQQVAVFKLAVEYCDALVKDTTARAKIFGSFNFAAAPNAAFDQAGKAAVADALVTKFWGKNLASLTPHADNVSMVVALIDDLMKDRDVTQAAATPGIATGVCAGVLASAPVTIY